MATQENVPEGENLGEGEGEVNEVPPTKILSEQQIEQVWNSSSPLQDLFGIYSLYFNPSNDPEYSIVDDNKIKFLSEFQIYNLIFLKNDLKLEYSQIVYVMDLLWNLLAINQDGTINDQAISAQGNFQDALNSKFEELKIELIAIAKQGVLGKDQIRSIMGYMKSGYFKHFRLIDYVIRNSQLPTLKGITLFHDEPLIQTDLDQAKELVEEPPMITHNEGEGEADAEMQPQDQEAAEGMN